MRTWLAALSLTLLAVPASAETTLSDYLAAAKKNNPSQRISRADLLNAEAARTEALAAVLPTLNFQANYTYNDRPVIIPFPDPSAATGFSDVTITSQHQSDASLNARVPLFDGPALARWRAARVAAQASADDSRVSEQELLMSVSRAYYGAVAAQELVRAAERSKAAAEQNAKIVRTRVEAGTATALFADRAELELSRDDQVLIDAKRASMVARRTLASLSGLPEPDSVPEAQLATDQVPPEDSWQKKAIENRPELASTMRRVQVAKLARSASWLQYAPVLSAHGSDRYSNATGFSGRNTTWSVGLTADWQLLEFGQRYGESRKAKAEVLRAEANLESKRVAVVDDVHSAWLDLDAARAKVEATRRGADVARKAAEEMRTRFGAGTATQLDVIQVERDLLTAEVDRIRAEADIALARLALEKAAGQEIR
jgi:outer membrane protein TolC